MKRTRFLLILDTILFVATVLLIAYNGLMLGAFLAVFAAKGLGMQAAGWLTIHGTTEIFAIILSGAAGFRIGTAIAFPGRAARTDFAFTVGRQASVAMAGAVVMLIVAGLLEGIGRQTVQVDWERYAIGLTVLTGWLTYFYMPRSRHVAVSSPRAQSAVGRPGRAALAGGRRRRDRRACAADTARTAAVSGRTRARAADAAPQRRVVG